MHQGGAEPGHIQTELGKLFAGGAVMDSTVWAAGCTELGSTCHRQLTGARPCDPNPLRSSLAASPGTHGTYGAVPGVQDSELLRYTTFTCAQCWAGTQQETLHSGSDMTRLRVPWTVIHCGDQSSSCCAPTLWNGLSSHLQGLLVCSTLTAFKGTLKTHLFCAYYEP